MQKAHLVISVLALLACTKACEVSSQSYTSREGISSSKTVFISTFTLKCADGRNNMNLFAEVGDQPLAVGRSADGKSYQVSWSEEHKSASTGDYTVKLYDAAGYSGMKKAQRAGESVEQVAPLASFTVNHQGVWQGAWASSETVACMAAVILAYFAYNRKSEILA